MKRIKGSFSFIGLFFIFHTSYGQKIVSKTSDVKEDSIVVLPPIIVEPINPFFKGELKFTNSTKSAVNEQSRAIEITKSTTKIDSSFSVPNPVKKQIGNSQEEKSSKKEIKMNQAVEKVN